MTGPRVAVLAACGALLVATCSSAVPTESGSTPLTGSASATPAPTLPQTQHVVAGPIELDAPATWHVRTGLPNPSGNVTFVYLSPIAMPSECQDSAQGGVCHPWPVLTLVNGGIVVAVRLHGMPGSRPPAGGEPMTVAGRPARRISGPADDACRVIGGTASAGIVLPAISGTSGWVGLDACLAGPDVAAAEGDLAAIVASVTIASGKASP